MRKQFSITFYTTDKKTTKTTVFEDRMESRAFNFTETTSIRLEDTNGKIHYFNPRHIIKIVVREI